MLIQKIAKNERERELCIQNNNSLLDYFHRSFFVIVFVALCYCFACVLIIFVLHWKQWKKTKSNRETRRRQKWKSSNSIGNVWITSQFYWSDSTLFTLHQSNFFCCFRSELFTFWSFERFNRSPSAQIWKRRGLLLQQIEKRTNKQTNTLQWMGVNQNSRKCNATATTVLEHRKSIEIANGRTFRSRPHSSKSSTLWYWCEFTAPMWDCKQWRVAYSYPKTVWYIFSTFCLQFARVFSLVVWTTTVLLCNAKAKGKKTRRKM